MTIRKFTKTIRINLRMVCLRSNKILITQVPHPFKHQLDYPLEKQAT